MRTVLELLGLRTPERGREPVALPSSVRWVLPLVVVSAALIGAIAVSLLGMVLLRLVGR